MSNWSARVVEHFTNPRNLGALPGADVTAEAANPCCGDHIRLYARFRGGRVAACSFLAYGCSAALAVGSLLAEAAIGKRADELAAFDEEGVAALAGGLAPGQRHCARLGSDVLHELASACGKCSPLAPRATAPSREARRTPSCSEGVLI
jgi:nitrogen fixation NifU-like protein